MPKPIMAHLSPEVITKFWSYVNIKGPDECWLWMGKKKAKENYGIFFLKGMILYSHRVAYCISSSEDPGALNVLHDCPGGDNPQCANPGHLRKGTQLENVADMVAKNRQATGDRTGSRVHPERQAKGERVNTAVLNTDQVLEIRNAYNGGYRNMAGLGRTYGVGRGTISKIIHRENWKHITMATCTASAAGWAGT